MTTHTGHEARTAIVERLCKLQAHVTEQLFGHAEANDCFCGERNPSGDNFRTTAQSVDFIVTAVLAAVRAERNRREVAVQGKLDEMAKPYMRTPQRLRDIADELEFLESTDVEKPRARELADELSKRFDEMFSTTIADA